MAAALHAVVDMGSNGIRFSISDLHPDRARLLPTLYHHRVGISLYDSQYTANGERVPIHDEILTAVVVAFKRFQKTCRDFGVPDENIIVLATEATRTAPNSDEFRARIARDVGWNVTMLSKEQEGRTGAMGIASSLPEVMGLVMDLGGGSFQLSWLVKTALDTEVKMPESGSVSLPFGAAALTRRIAQARESGSIAVLEKEMHDGIKSAYESLQVPTDLQDAARRKGGFTLYAVGGGFRGWGYILMSQHRLNPYPIPIINGFKISGQEFFDASNVMAAAHTSLGEGDETNIFRVSKRRAGQADAVSLLVRVLAQALPAVGEVQFCQGGVREGYLFSSLPAKTQAQLPLVVATREFHRRGSLVEMVALLSESFPTNLNRDASDGLDRLWSSGLIESFAALIYYHANHPKDLQASCGLRSTTSGILASAHGVLHESRALLGLLLCARWGDDLSAVDMPFKQSLEQLVGVPWTLWWVKYGGAIAALIATVYPVGISSPENRLRFETSWATDEKSRSILVLHARVPPEVNQDSFLQDARAVEKVGKRKNWIGGRDGVGYQIRIEVSSLQ